MPKAFLEHLARAAGLLVGPLFIVGGIMYVLTQRTDIALVCAGSVTAIFIISPVGMVCWESTR